jgi:hypothetical protein
MLRASPLRRGRPCALQALTKSFETVLHLT